MIVFNKYLTVNTSLLGVSSCDMFSRLYYPLLLFKLSCVWHDVHSPLCFTVFGMMCRPPVAGIHGGEEGAYSIALSGGYEDDIDLGDCFTYTGEGLCGKDWPTIVFFSTHFSFSKQSLVRLWEVLCRYLCFSHQHRLGYYSSPISRGQNVFMPQPRSELITSHGNRHFHLPTF